MKIKVLSSIFGIFVCALLFSGCVKTYSFKYNYDELKNSLVQAEIIYMAENVNFFSLHWYIDIPNTDYEVKKILDSEKADELIRDLSNIAFEYSVLYVPASVSNSYNMQGYCIKLSYADETFMILAQTGDYRSGKSKLPQSKAGRKTTEDNWNTLISKFYSEI